MPDDDDVSALHEAIRLGLAIKNEIATSRAVDLILRRADERKKNIAFTWATSPNLTASEEATLRGEYMALDNILTWIKETVDAGDQAASALAEDEDTTEGDR